MGNLRSSMAVFVPCDHKLQNLNGTANESKICCFYESPKFDIKN